MDRKQQIVRVGYVGVAANIVIAGVKAAIGLLSGSMAVVMDAINNMADAMSSILTIVGVKLAGYPANDKHPFGYGRIEYFSAVIISVLILITGISSLVEAVKGIFEPSEQTFTLVGIAIIGISVIAKLFLGLFTRNKGRELDSDSLIASGTECMLDCIVSVATIVSALITMLLGVSLDAYVAAVIACLIIKVGFEMLMAPIAELLGKRSDLALVSGIKTKVRSVDHVLGVYDVVLHDYGPERKVGALHVEVDDTLSAAQLHHLTRQIQKVVRYEYGIVVTVGFYAHHQAGSDVAVEEERIRKHVMSLDGVLGMHGFYVSETEKMVSFDIVYSFKVHKPISLKEEIVAWLESDYPGYEIIIGLDPNFSE